MEIMRIADIIEWVLHTEGPLVRSEIKILLLGNSIYGPEFLKEDFLDAKIDLAIKDCWLVRNSVTIEEIHGTWGISETFNGEKPWSTMQHHSKPWLKMGTGPESVYAIFFNEDMYRSVAIGNLEWPIKIGRTSRDISKRISEFQTGCSQPIQLGIHFLCEDSRELENHIHSKLQTHGILEGAGTEWYLTSPFVIKNIYKSYARVKYINNNLEKVA